MKYFLKGQRYNRPGEKWDLRILDPEEHFPKSTS
jgi:hypothetical protein